MPEQFSRELLREFLDFLDRQGGLAEAFSDFLAAGGREAEEAIYEQFDWDRRDGAQRHRYGALGLDPAA